VGDIVDRIRNRLNDAPMPTERLLDEAADRIAELEAAISDVVKVLDGSRWRSLFEHIAAVSPELLMQDLPRVDMVRLRQLMQRHT